MIRLEDIVKQAEDAAHYAGVTRLSESLRKLQVMLEDFDGPQRHPIVQASWRLVRSSAIDVSGELSQMLASLVQYRVALEAETRAADEPSTRTPCQHSRFCGDCFSPQYVRNLESQVRGQS